ncbi:hypothetical protein CHGG_00068 [Chaetomium globosum CBS 148.51]|uniref:DUF6603 domain-containing protein n=1 Tax=Chaetomium globosum (strain ATCC 6205 / CBS 148.51 / DSM 1962 / NBRC 6347 / NRRL 1970) TaxID=306901 RepID=Q2HI86_CHAGB|nr:uncharacterized protein CHGG_00068 [Chaetomium globosum CBS 148.51]EAQ91833.1 hypothetical protein CHGG_00068 [Chaetomium globosum CBS 148.51]
MLEITPHQRRLVASVPGARGTLAAAAEDSGTKYTIYSSKAGKSPGDNVHVLSPSPKNIDNFLSLLPDEALVLSAKPTGTTATLDASDKWATWMTNWDASGELSMTYDNATNLNIQYFQFHIKAPWNVTFSSSADALKFSFGTTSMGGDSLVPSPGMTDAGSPIYFGLDPKETPGDLKSSVGELFKFAGLDALGKNLPIKGLDLLKTTLKLSNTDGPQRNALWFSPEQHLKTTMRLQFELDSADALENALTSVLKGLEFQSFSIACKKTLVFLETNNGATAVTGGDVNFEMQCSVQHGGSEPVKMLLCLQLTRFSYQLTFKIDSKDGLEGIIAWLASLIPGGGGVDAIEQIFGMTGDLFTKHIFLRRLKIGVSTAGKSPKLSSVGLDIEVSSDQVGQGSSKSQRAAFLITYSWLAGMGGAGSLNGGFWNVFDADEKRVLDPSYLATLDLQPLTESPATQLDLVTLIPGQTVDNLPDTVPTQITLANLYLDQKQFAIRATVQSKQSLASDQDSTVPQLDLGKVNLTASYQWAGGESALKFHLGIASVLTPSINSKHPTSAMLTGSIDYDSKEKKWVLDTELKSLYVSNLISFFDKGSADDVLPLIDSLLIDHVSLHYEYTGARSSELKDKSVGTYFKFDGKILVGGLSLQLDFNFKNKEGWVFKADLVTEDKEATIGDIVTDMLGDDSLDLPDFLANTKINASGQTGGISLKVEKSPGTDGMFQFMSSIQIGDLALTFAQIHLTAWGPKAPSKRFIKFGLVALPSVPLPLIGDVTQPFDEMYLMWVQDGTNLNKANPGLTRQEVTDLNKSLGQHPLVPKDKFQDKTNQKDVLITAGSHFAIITKDQQGNRTCVLDYDFKKAKPKQPKAPSSAQGGTLAITEAGEEAKDDPEPKPDSDGNSASAPFKKKSGPLSISNIGLKYADKTLHIQFTATFELGPIGFALIGFSINVQITSLDLGGIHLLDPSLEGLAASFEKPPLTIAGLVRHGKDRNGLPYYSGGLIVGWVPYQLQAAGFYGQALPEGVTDLSKAFNSVFVFARLDGPLVSLEFAEISGVTGGFGYKSEVRVPTADQIVEFPFIKPASLAGATGSAIETLERLTSPNSDGWFKPLDDTYWAAAGMKIDAFQMISLQAVAVVQFGQSIKMGLFAVALADIPTSASKVKFAHVELGIAVVVDLDYGTFKAEAQLSPNSYILDPNCHLTGGFALYYWFEAPHADQSLAYFAITPKACMGGGRLHAAYHLGPIEAWFDAFADFLINYKPFHFMAEAGVSVGVRFNLDVLFVHIHISVEVGADLKLWGPPFAGDIYIDIKVHKFSIPFGNHSTEKPPASLVEFYNLVLQASSKTDSSPKAAAAPALATAVFPADSPRVVELDDDQPIAMAAAEDGEDDKPKKNEAHTFLAQSGLMNDVKAPERTHNQDWTVRGGSFAFVLGCKMAIGTANQVNETGGAIQTLQYTDKPIYAKPMHLGGSDTLTSSVDICITEKDSHDPPKKWRMESVLKSVPTGLWAPYDTSTDPSQSGNNIDSLLETTDGSVLLMMGVLLHAPPPFMSEDKQQTFKILDAELKDIDANDSFPQPVSAGDQWVGAPPLEGAAQWDEVHKAWATPDWDSVPAAAAAEAAGEEAREGEGEVEAEEPVSVQTMFVTDWATAFGWDKALSSIAKMPSLLNRRFDQLYVAAPLVTK